jgi:cobalt-zinc-cadmium efflux system outer membrane protein
MGLGRIVLALALVVSVPQVIAAQTTVSSVGDVLEQVRERAPQAIGARLAVAEARARLLGASLRLQANPEIEAAIGNRHGDTDRFTDMEIVLSQRFEPRGRRTARMQEAKAAIAMAEAELDDVIRTSQRDAVVAYYRSLHAAARQRLWEAAEQLAAGVEQAADRRFKAGDVAVLDVNLARASRARARADRHAAAAGGAAAIGELQQLLRVTNPLVVTGQLETPPDASLTGLLDAALRRPDLRAIEAAIREAEATVQFGRSFAKPEYGVSARYEEDGGDRVVLGGLTVTLPVFAKGQEFTSVGSARVTRLRAALEAARDRVHIEVRSRFTAYEHALSALRALGSDAVPGLDENERLLNRSFEVGQIGLPDLLLIRREILDTRFQYLDALLQAALARTELHASAGVLR